MQTPIHIDSRFPAMGTTIFTVMSRLAAECGAINLSQGFPDFQAAPALFDAMDRHMRAGRNQYAPMAGMPELRQAIVDKVAALYGTRFDFESEVTVTAGATQAIFTAIAAFVRPGDEVIVFEPVYDSYVPAIETVGGKAVYAQLQFPDYAPDWAQVARLITPRTRMIIVNSPHNPTGSLLTAVDLEKLAELVRGTDIVVLSDEVYEHILFDGERHASVCGHAELAPRSIVVSSFGKTYHITGWKIGYVVGPAALMAEFRKVHQFNVFTVHTPSQLALADYMQDASRHLGLAAVLSGKARFLPQPDGGHAVRAAALPRHLLPAGALQGDLRPARPRLRRVDDARGRRRGHSGIRVLCRRTRRPRRAFLLRQEGGNAGRRRRAPAPPVNGALTCRDGRPIIQTP